MELIVIGHPWHGRFTVCSGGWAVVSDYYSLSDSDLASCAVSACSIARDSRMALCVRQCIAQWCNARCLDSFFRFFHCQSHVCKSCETVVRNVRCVRQTIWSVRRHRHHLYTKFYFARAHTHIHTLKVTSLVAGIPILHQESCDQTQSHPGRHDVSA